MSALLRRLALICCVLICSVASAALPLTLEALTKTIAEGEGREVYEAFRAIPKYANTPEKQTNAFIEMSRYLGRGDKRCVVQNFYPLQYRATARHFSYAELAHYAIMGLGEPGMHGLLNSLNSKQPAVADQAALILCDMEDSARHVTAKPGTGFRLLDAIERKALETFLQQHGDRLPVDYLTRFVRAEFPTAVPYIHRRLKNTKDLEEEKRAAVWLGAYRYSPALDDLLNILSDHPDGHIRQLVAGQLSKFAESDRILKALNEVLRKETNDDVRTWCRIASQEIRSKQESQK